MSEGMDDFDLEVSSLAPSPAATDAGDEDATSTPETARVPTISLQATRHVSLTARRTQTWQFIRAGGVAAFLTLLISAVLLASSGNRDAVLRLLTPPTPFPTATPLAGSDAFLWQHSVSWGRLLVDGKPGPDVRGSAIQRGADGFPMGAMFHLARGRHTIEYRAAPFPTLNCTVSVPFSRNDTCPLASYSDFSFLAPNAPAARLLDLQASIDRLPRADVAALVVAAQAQLTLLADALPAGALEVGDHYRDQTGQITQAHSAMQIEPQFHLDMSNERYESLICVILCTDAGLTLYSPGSWVVQAPVVLTWRYTTPAGQVILADGRASLSGVSPVTLITFLTRWSAGNWLGPTPVFEAPETDPVICPTGGHYLDVFQQLPDQAAIAHNVQWPYAASTAELGCVFAGSEMDANTGKPTGPISLMFYRAGALVAANEQAHQIFPKLPVASTHERALANAVAPASLS
jgi:hypothetical protein